MLKLLKNAKFYDLNRDAVITAINGYDTGQVGFALGQFGMNPLAALKQGIVDHVRSAAFITLEELRAVFHRDERAQEFPAAYNDLTIGKEAWRERVCQYR